MNRIALLAVLLALPAIAQHAPSSLGDGTYAQAAALQDLDVAQLRYLPGENGRSRILLRLENAEAPALRLHLKDLALPVGATLVIYGIDENSQFTQQDGPFTAAGPMGGSDFWTRPVAGRTLIVEYQTPEETAQLPFTVEGWEAAEPYAFAPLEAEPDGETVTSVFRGQAVTHQVVDGHGLWEGDILLGRVEELEAYGGDEKQLERSAGAIYASAYRWPNGVIPYTIDPAIGNQARITAAISHWNTSLAGSIRMVARTNETYYIRFTLASATTCSSYIGYIRMAAQPVNIGDYCSTGNVIHEIGHAIGLYHEQSRSDRDSYVRIVMENISPAAIGNFSKVTGSLNPGTYDYSSIMHYPANAFSMNGQATIVTIPAGIPIGQRSTLSTLDIAGVRSLYPSTTATTNPPPTGTPVNYALTVGSAPAGRKVTVDNKTYSTTTTLPLPANSTHTVAAPNAIEGNNKYTFVNWSDGGAQTHGITLTGTRSLTASYATAYKFTATASAGGRVLQSLTTADSYYPAGTRVSLQAVANGGYCFRGWTNFIDVVDAGIVVTLNGSGSTQANFAAGAITLPGSLTAAKAGGTVSLPVTASGGCAWRAQSATSWITIGGTATGKGSASLRLTVAGNPTATPRYGYVMVGNRYVVIYQN